MKFSLKYILASFIILSLTGLSENIYIICSDVKYINETEWLTTVIPDRGFSKCCQYIQYYDTQFTSLDLKSWLPELKSYYNQKVNVIFLSQTKIFCSIDTLNLIFNKLYNPRKSIENQHISYRMTESLTKYSHSRCICQETGNNMWNSSLRREWINQKIKFYIFSKELNALHIGLDGWYT